MDSDVAAADKERIADAIVDARFRRRYSPFLLALIEANMFDALPAAAERTGGDQVEQQQQGQGRRQERKVEVDYAKLGFRSPAFRYNIAMFL